MSAKKTNTSNVSQLFLAKTNGHSGGRKLGSKVSKIIGGGHFQRTGIVQRENSLRS
jgi:hypothetical protein